MINTKIESPRRAKAGTGGADQDQDHEIGGEDQGLAVKNGEEVEVGVEETALEPGIEVEAAVERERELKQQSQHAPLLPRV